MNRLFSIVYVSPIAHLLLGFVAVAQLSRAVQPCAEGTCPLLPGDEFVAFQMPLEKQEADTKMHIVKLRRESVPIYRRGKIASFKTSYSGVIQIGKPAQEFRVIFDTGSGHLVVPAAHCPSESCQVHRQFNKTASASAVPIQTDGNAVPKGMLSDQVIVGFGTGEITGEFVRDKVCISDGVADDELPKVAAAVESSAGNTALPAPATPPAGPCLTMHVITAVRMSKQPFYSFNFDGILGLGLSDLAITADFSLFSLLVRRGAVPHFAAFLTEGEDGEESEMVFGGHNPERMLGNSIAWTPVNPNHDGYWQIKVFGIRVNGKLLDFCNDGLCKAVVDTGTSHFGVPAPLNDELDAMLEADAGDLLDCRNVEAPEVQLELHGFNMTLYPHNYMRRLPLRVGINVGSAKGVVMEDPRNPSSTPSSNVASPPPSASEIVAQIPNTTVVANATATEIEEQDVRRTCKPRTTGVRVPAPLGPKLFIFGEPILHRYYSIYDWKTPAVGFALANNRRNTEDPSKRTGRGELPKEVDMLLMQRHLEMKLGRDRYEPIGFEAAEDEVSFAQRWL